MADEMQTSDTAPSPAAEALRRTSWLSEVAPGTLDGLADQSALLKAPAGVQLFEQAETPGFALFLLEGAVDLLAVRGAEEIMVELVRAVDILLPAAVLARLPYLVRARVHEDSQLLLVPAEPFRHAVASDQAFCLAVLACQAAQFRRQMKLAKSIRLRSTEERVGAFLVALCAENAGATSIRLPLEKRLIASRLGMSRETLSRTLPAMARHGLRVVGDRLHVDDLASAMAAFPPDPLIDGPEPISPLKPIEVS